ncbi:(2,3-dihydroxybenzoyl)adenylate synthase [Saccharothrix algeriensis]|uniref:2,3-dihydroxybenzoate-AMP ligase n=1 Tax=Saccharothrix algeriensis TaxID=173560 RepID=A0A8T8HYA3_9PSEU|nr:AMP-binding protein [Saccharothrix algeriensis]MBM7815108.1 2,3-dihydroxybenzoate-AMP ligase [Saccharothrix algeriensis]QTR03359.1 AMP-binding protein [Saccharothrix algeriensis]
MSDHVPFPPDFAARYRAAGHWRGQTFGALLTSLAAAHAGRTAVVGEGARWTYAELDDRAHRIAAGLAGSGVRPGDRVVVQLPNVPEFVPAVFGLWRAGALPVFALPAHRDSELRHFAAQSEAVAILTVDHHERHDHAGTARAVADDVSSVREVLVVGSPEWADLVATAPRELPDPDPGGVAFLQLSGGSTGLPKLIPRTHDDYLYSVRESARICALRPDSVYLAALPAAHNYPLSSPGVLGALHAGAKTVLAPRPDADTAFRLIEQEGVTISGVVPPLAAAWVQAAARTTRDLSTLEVLLVGGAKCGRELAERIGPALGCRLQQVFGMAEGLVCYTRLDDPDEVVLGTQGRPISPDDEIRVVDPVDPASGSDAEVPPGEVGALLTRGPYTIRGYYRAEEHNRVAFTPDGFYRTGDLVRRTPTGHLEVVGRAKEQINRGGEKVAAEEVENHLMAHPDVLDAAVVAVPDQYLGERTCAYVVPAEGAAPTPAQLRRFVRDRGVAAFKVPDLVQVVAEFPVTGVGKTSKRELRAALAALAERG